MSRIESAIRVVTQLCEAFNRHDVSAMTVLISEDCILQDSVPAPDGALYAGRADIAGVWGDRIRESARTKIEVEDVFCSGSRCVLRWQRCWVDSAGEKKHVRGVDVIRVRNDLICEVLSYVKG